MNQELDQVLGLIETDMSPAAGSQFVELAASYFLASSSPSRPVSTRLTPGELKGRFAGGFPDIPGGLEDVLQRVQDDVVSDSNWLYHPRYMGHQVTAPLPAAVWTEAIIGALNNSVAVQEMSPAITMVERQVIQWMTSLIGWGAAAGGTFTSGGTEATFTALLAARAKALPDAWENGTEGVLPVVLCGEHAHYAVTRAIAQLGLGLKRAIQVPSRDFRMDVVALRKRLKALQENGIPVMAVVATAGSTATGAFDRLDQVGDVCDEFGVWLHVDGAHGASALLSNVHRKALKGIERARSIAWDPHKMMLMPLSAGVLLVRDEPDLDAAFRQRAPYLFNPVDGERTPDQGGRSFLCSRRGDALKVWVSLHRYGTRAFGLLYDYFCDLAVELHGLLDRHPRFEVLHAPQCNILCFRYVGNGDRSAGDTDALNLQLRNEYNSRGTGWITSTVLGGKRVLRVTLINPRIRTQHLVDMLEELDRTASELAGA